MAEPAPPARRASRGKPGGRLIAGEFNKIAVPANATEQRGPAPERQRAERHGRRAEAWAAFMLRLKGFRILARRLKTPFGEIDLIARRGRTLVFVEVKARASREAALDAITPTARARISRAASYWIGRRPAALGFSMRFDVVVVIPRRWPQHIPAAFDGENGG